MAKWLGEGQACITAAIARAPATQPMQPRQSATGTSSWFGRWRRTSAEAPFVIDDEDPFSLGLMASHAKYGTAVPFVLSTCVTHVEREGLDQEGIYRLAGGASATAATRAALVKGGASTALGTIEPASIHSVCGTLQNHRGNYVSFLANSLTLLLLFFVHVLLLFFPFSLQGW